MTAKEGEVAGPRDWHPAATLEQQLLGTQRLGQMKLPASQAPRPLAGGGRRGHHTMPGPIPGQPVFT